MNRVIFCIEIDLLHCLVTKGTAFKHKQLKKILKECDWLRVDIVLGDKGSDTRNCFNKITNHGSIPGIKIRKNASRKAHDCPSRRKAVIAQQQDIESWKIKKFKQQCVVLQKQYSPRRNNDSENSSSA